MSASPAASQNDGQASGQPAKSGNEQVKFRFCGDCSNMLAPKEDRINNKLMYCCRMCQYSEEADSACIFRNNIYNVIGETAGVTQDVGSDPTVGLPDFWCTLCGQTIACGICEEEFGPELEVDDRLSEDGREDIGDEKRDDVNGVKASESTNKAAAAVGADRKLQSTKHGGRTKYNWLT